MRIDRPTTTHIGDHVSTDRADARARSDRAGAAGRPGGAAVVVALGSATRQVGALPKDVADRLERVRAQIADGSYQVDFDKLAERLVDEELARVGG
ncbi:MAG: flagellar biosynthesis anti-sigma factor FlgM [Deltaproteobacteria bacterium]|nr:MAG: flagellar biosynthesis anti-sigma factor FlgM [Deltaproteobacteria bacterium]